MRFRKAQEYGGEQGNCFPRRRERVLAPVEFTQTIAEIVQRPREIRQEGVGPVGHEAAVNVRRLARRRQRVFAPAETA